MHNITRSAKCLALLVFSVLSMIILHNLTGLWRAIIPNKLAKTFLHARQGDETVPFNFTVQEAPLDLAERRLIILNVEPEIQFDPVADFLKRHRQVVFFGQSERESDKSSLLPLSDNSYLLDMCFRLYECSAHYLSYFVDYANERLLTPGQRRWCGGNRRRQLMQQASSNLSQQQARISHSDCQPVKKVDVKTFCQNHHLAFKLSLSPLEHHQEKLQGSHVRIIHLSVASSRELSWWNSGLPHETSGIDDGSITISASNNLHFRVSDFSPPGNKWVFLELLNFLDLYEIDQAGEVNQAR